jgi:predicted house-cleaning noncanonical NTP pyrophosphatase (MazG superfamily)
MTEYKLATYQEVTKSLHDKKRQKHLLMGNGFSMSYDSEIFSYNKLAEFLENLENPILKKLFEIIKTSNFELLMEQLDNVAKISEVFGADKKVVDKIHEATSTLKKSLIDAIKELHPEHVFAIPEEKSQACASFLNSFLAEDGEIFTTNYDLLLYWVLMRNDLDKKGDGFGREAEETDEWIPEEDIQWSELRWGKHRDSQSIYYIHGALHLFDARIDIIKEEYTNEHVLLENVKARMKRKEYPIFVTAGNGAEKLSHIRHNRYLSHCYDILSSLSGSLVCFGFGFGQYDEHIIAAINKATKKRIDENGKWHMLNSIYIGLYSESDIKHIQSIESKFKCKVNLFDAKTVNVWGK